jgi:SNF2 family DNA or RNA helicase
MRTYGTVRLQEETRTIFIRLEPQVAMRFKRVFPKIEKGKTGVLHLSCTPENCRDLDWFMDRYPLECDHIERIWELSHQHQEKQTLVDKFLNSQSDPLPLELAVPAREYQLIGASMFLTTGALLLADDVGLGKTATAIAALTDPRTRPAVYVTLTHLPLQVQRMIGRFAPGLTTHVIKTGQPYDVTRQRGKTGPYPDVVILSYSKLSGWADTLAKVCRCVIWDEVQELRHSNSNKHDAALVLTEAAKFRMGMSATPIYNYGGEIFNVMRTIAPDALGNWDEFYTEWCGAGGGKDKARIQNPAAFGSYLRENGLMLRRTRKDVKRELPPCFSDVQHVEADIYALEQVSRSCAELAEMLLSSSGRGFDKMRAASDFDWRLRQATGIAKAPYVADFVRLLVESGEKVVLYGWHHAVYAIWRDKLKDIPLAMYTGEESTTQKEAAKHAFTDGDAKVLIMSLRSGAGLDGLQGSCNIVCFGELDWSPGVHEQAIGRIWRDGQENQVNVYFMVSDEGSDPFMVEVNGVKEQQIKGIRDPDAEMVQKLQVDPDRVKELARRYLNRFEVTV